MKSCLGMAAPGLALAVLLGLPGPVQGAGATPAGDAGRDPIAYSGHGALFGPNHEQISSVTPEFLATALAHYTGRALAAATPSQRAAYEQKRSFVATLTAGDRSAQLVAESLLLDWLIDAAQPADAATLRQRNSLVKQALHRRSAGAIDDYRRAMLAQAGLLAPVTAAAAGLPVPPFAVSQAREAYLKRCKEAGVPLPPDWGKNGGADWNSKGDLSSTFILRGSTAEVVVHEGKAPVGLCMALPRHASGPTSDIDQLGIICMGKGKADSSGKVISAACFWDNQFNKKTVPIGRNTPVPILNFAAGEELKDGQGNICTMCHAGENAFIIHPDEPAMTGLPNLKPDAYYTPLVHVNWPQNKTPNTKLGAVPPMQKSCLTCHEPADAGRLPEITMEINGYCGAVVKPAIERTMPPGAGPKPNDKYKEHLKVIREECAKVNPPPP